MAVAGTAARDEAARIHRLTASKGWEHFTLSFPLKLPADAKALAEQLPPTGSGLSNGIAATPVA